MRHRRHRTRRLSDGNIDCLGDAHTDVTNLATIGGSAIGAVLAARRPFAEPWHSGAGAVAGAGLVFLIAQGISLYYKNHR